MTKMLLFVQSSNFSTQSSNFLQLTGDFALFAIRFWSNMLMKLTPGGSMGPRYVMKLLFCEIFHSSTITEAIDILKITGSSFQLYAQACLYFLVDLSNHCIVIINFHQNFVASKHSDFSQGKTGRTLLNEALSPSI